jgi:hypothetical protein
LETHQNWQAKMKYIVGHSESNFGEQDFVVLSAENEQDAIKKFLDLYGIKEDIFLEHVYDRSINFSFAEHFWLVTDNENEHFENTGEVLIDKDIFNQRVRDFFGHHSDYANSYINHYWSDKEYKPEEKLFSDGMLIYIWMQSDFGSITAIQQFDEEKESDYQWDVFISHASEDKEVFVKKLAKALERRKLRVWYDDFSLKIGDSLTASIDKGLAKSRFGIVVISPNFMKKEWTQKELGALVTRESQSEKVILPIWLNVSVSQVVKFSPMLADKKAIQADAGIASVVSELMNVINSNK